MPTGPVGGIFSGASIGTARQTIGGPFYLMRLNLQALQLRVQPIVNLVELRGVEPLAS